MTQATILDLNSMMNETLDTIAEAPDYIDPPAGEYVILVQEAKIDQYKDKAGAACQRLKISYSVQETLSTLNDEPPVANSSLFTETFQGTEQGLSFFKKRIREVLGVTDVQGVTLGDMMNSAKGVVFNCRISYKKSTSNGKEYTNLQMKVITS